MSINRACRRRNRRLRWRKSSPKRRNSPEDYSGESVFAADSVSARRAARQAGKPSMPRAAPHRALPREQICMATSKRGNGTESDAVAAGTEKGPPADIGYLLPIGRTKRKIAAPYSGAIGPWFPEETVGSTPPMGTQAATPTAEVVTQRVFAAGKTAVSENGPVPRAGEFPLRDGGHAANEYIVHTGG